MKNKYNTVVLISVNEVNARKVCERIQGDFIEDFSNHPEICDIDPANVLIYNLSDFMDLVNDQTMDVLTEYFVTFVNTQ